MAESLLSEPALLIHKSHHLVQGGHGNRTPVPGRDHGAAGIAQPGGLVKLPTLGVPIKKPRAEGVAGPEDILHLHLESRHVFSRLAAPVKAQPIRLPSSSGISANTVLQPGAVTQR